MVRTKKEQIVDYKCIRGGIGEAEMHLLLNGEGEMYKKGRMFNHMVLAPGNTIGYHSHSGDNEIFYILKGTGIYTDNGTEVRIRPGDVTVCNDGESHGLVNDGDEAIEFIALILYNE